MANQNLKELLAETTRLRERFEKHSPDSSRLAILIRDERALRRMLEAA